jgi:DNA replication protein DnaC
LLILEEERQKFKLRLGKRSDNIDFTINPYRGGILLAGPSGEGKSTFTTAFMESLLENRIPVLHYRPEWDYFDFPGTELWVTQSRSRL